MPKYITFFNTHNLSIAHILIFKGSCCGLQWIKELNFVKFVVRYKDFMLAAWLISDMTLDGLMTTKYYDQSFGESAVNGSWKIYHLRSTSNN